MSNIDEIHNCLKVMDDHRKFIKHSLYSHDIFYQKKAELETLLMKNLPQNFME